MELTNVQISKPAPGTTDIYFFREVDDVACFEFTKELTALNASLLTVEKNISNKLQNSFNIEHKVSYPVTIHLNTPGGWCYQGFSMMQYINHLRKSRPVEIRCSGLVASMGIAILLSVPVENRVAYADTTFMIHQVSSIALGKLADIEESVNEAARINERLFYIIKHNTKITEERLNKCYIERQDWFLTAEQALELGLISKIIY